MVSLPGREPRANVRYVVTNLELDAEQVMRSTAKRGDGDNRIKELKDALGRGRTSCHAFWANQLRVLLAAAAFVPMQELRQRSRKIGAVIAATGVSRRRRRSCRPGAPGRRHRWC